MGRSSLSIAIVGTIAATIVVAPAAAHAFDQDGGYRGASTYGDRRVDYRRGDDRDHDRCRNNGTGGAIIGAIAGGLLGNAVAGYGDRAAGTIVGGVGGALAGRAIDRDC